MRAAKRWSGMGWGGEAKGGEGGEPGGPPSKYKKVVLGNTADHGKLQRKHHNAVVGQETRC